MVGDVEWRGRGHGTRSRRREEIRLCARGKHTLEKVWIRGGRENVGEIHGDVTEWRRGGMFVAILNRHRHKERRDICVGVGVSVRVSLCLCACLVARCAWELFYSNWRLFRSVTQLPQQIRRGAGLMGLDKPRAWTGKQERHPKRGR